MRAVIGVQIDDLLRADAAGQRRRPAVKFVLRHDQLLAPGADGALHEPQHTAHGSLDALHEHRLLSQRHALACMGMRPHHGTLAAGARELACIKPRGHLGPVRAARLLLDEEVHLHLSRLVQRLHARHQRGRVEARVQPRKQRRLRPRCTQPLRHLDPAAQLGLGVLGRVLRAGTPRQLQRPAVRSNVRRRRAVAVHTCTGAALALLLPCRRCPWRRCRCPPPSGRRAARRSPADGF